MEHNVSEKLQSQIAVVHKASDDIRSRFTTPAKLKNFDYDESRMKALEEGFAALCLSRNVLMSSFNFFSLRYMPSVFEGRSQLATIPALY